MVFLDEDGCDESERVSILVSDTLERATSAQILMTGGTDDEVEP